MVYFQVQQTRDRVRVFITAVPIIKLFAWGEGDSGGHVLRETTSRGLYGLYFFPGPCFLSTPFTDLNNVCSAFPFVPLVSAIYASGVCVSAG